MHICTHSAKAGEMRAFLKPRTAGQGKAGDERVTRTRTADSCHFVPCSGFLELFLSVTINVSNPRAVWR